MTAVTPFTGKIHMHSFGLLGTSTVCNIKARCRNQTLVIRDGVNIAQSVPSQVISNDKLDASRLKTVSERVRRDDDDDYSFNASFVMVMKYSSLSTEAPTPL